MHMSRTVGKPVVLATIIVLLVWSTALADHASVTFSQTNSTSGKRPGEVADRLLLEGGNGVAVDVRGHGHRLVAEDFLHHLDGQMAVVQGRQRLVVERNM